MKRLSKILAVVFIFICAFSLTSCKKEELLAPVNITIDEENNLIWDSVDDAKSYTVFFLNVDQNITTFETIRKTSYSLDELEEGDYQITIKSISSTNDKKDSPDSEIIYYHKYPDTGCVYKLINNNTEYAISKVGSAQGTFVIEDYYRGKAVTEISDKAFKGSTKVVDVTLGANIITIGESAFWNCPRLERIVIPNSVISIGKSAFQSCRSLTNIELPEYLTVVPEYCFAYCRNLENITFPENIKSILDSSFVDCSSLTEIIIPDNTEIIGSSAFFGCENLTIVRIGSGIEYIKESAFSTCHSLTSVTFKEASNLKEIGKSAFRDCNVLETINLPAGLVMIGESCFYNAALLNEIHIPLSVTGIGANAFLGTKLFNDQIQAGENFVYADNWLIFSPAAVRNEIEEISPTTLKDTVVGVADNVFEGCPELKIVTLPQSFKYIGAYAFNSCPKLWKFLTLPDSIKIIGDYAFTGCALTNVSLGMGLERIGHFAFYGNQNLDNNELLPYDWIPESVTSIGKGAFNNTMMYAKASYGNGIVYAGNWAVGLALPLTSIDLEFDPDHVAGIADYAFMYEGFPELASIFSVRSVSGLTNCKYIGVGAFYGNIELSSVSLNRNLTEIREATFYNTGLVKATLPRSLKSIGDYAFSGTQLTSLDLSTTNVESIGKSAFCNVGGMIEVTFNDSLKTIGDYAFFGCSNIKSAILPNSVTSIGENAFSGCEALENVKLSTNVDVLRTAVFSHCSSLKHITGLENIKKIESEAFYGCSSLEDVDLGDETESIGDAAFFLNENLKYIYLSNKVKEIGTYAFQGCNSLKSIIIPGSVRTIQQHAFYECFNLTIYTSMQTKPGDWHSRYNSSNRTTFWNTELDEQNNVVGINISDDYLTFRNAANGISSPISRDKLFVYWTDSSSKQYETSELAKISGELKLTAHYEGE
ncbi:leucine-rich repeat domain-containing protein [bacterium]|nr:leucine-rich repeat domain-containing protein [bacterium]